MKKFIAACVAVSALAFSSLAAAVPIQTIGLSLIEATGGTPLCLAGCYGTIDVDLDGESSIYTAAPGVYDITAVNITIPEIPETFGTISGISFVQVDASGNIGIYGSSATTGNIELSFNDSDWNVFGVDAGGNPVSGGGSATAIPEPASLALLGAGLVGFGLSARRRKMKKM